jgi:hypothetical protein
MSSSRLQSPRLANEARGEGCGDYRRHRAAPSPGKGERKRAAAVTPVAAAAVEETPVAAAAQALDVLLSGLASGMLGDSRGAECSRQEVVDLALSTKGPDMREKAAGVPFPAVTGSCTGMTLAKFVML